MRHAGLILIGLLGTVALTSQNHLAAAPRKEIKPHSPHAIQDPKAKSKSMEEGLSHLPRPDSSFASSPLWDNGQTEILVYSVELPGEMEGAGFGRLTTKLGVSGKADAHSSKPGVTSGVENISAALTCTWPKDGGERIRTTIDQLPRRGALRLLRQDQSISAFPTLIHRTLDCREFPPKVKVLADDDEDELDTALAEWPIYTEEMLFTYLRALPQHAGYREDAWIVPGGEPGRFLPKAKFASIEMRASAMVRDVETWYVTVDVEDAGRLEFWVSANGLHPVVMAILSDRSTWILQEMERRKLSLR